VDTLAAGSLTGTRGRKRRRSIKERREMVEETLVAGASVSRVARRHDVNANQLFHWRKLYREGRLGGSPAQLLAVKVSADPVVRPELARASGTMEIKVGRGLVRVAGPVDVQALRAVLECLAG
jgi:transposase